MEFRFVLRPLPDDQKELQTQVSAGLERLTEQRSREKLPRLWKLTDALSRSQAARGRISERRRNLRRVLALFDWLLGLVALAPALMNPTELWGLLLAGGAAFGVGTGILWVLWRKPLGVISLLAGGLLIFAGFGAPEQLGSVMGLGIVCLLLGGTALFSGRLHRETPYDRAARELLAHARDFLGDIDTLWLLPEGIGATFQSEAAPETLLPYKEVERMVETDSLWILVLQDKAMLLQKSELQGDPEEFRAFLREVVPVTEK